MGIGKGVRHFRERKRGERECVRAAQQRNKRGRRGFVFIYAFRPLMECFDVHFGP